MNSLTATYLSALVFSAEQASVMRALGEYRGKQRLYERQRPELLEALVTVAKNASAISISQGKRSLSVSEKRLNARSSRSGSSISSANVRTSAERRFGSCFEQ